MSQYISPPTPNAEDAVAKKHSTVSEAIDVACRMGAHRTILTHFSQRYPALSPLPEDVSGRVLVAFDLLSVSFSNLRWAHNPHPHAHTRPHPHPRPLNFPHPHLRWAPHSVPVLRCIFPPEEVSEDAVDAVDGEGGHAEGGGKLKAVEEAGAEVSGHDGGR